MRFTVLGAVLLAGCAAASPTRPTTVPAPSSTPTQVRASATPAPTLTPTPACRPGPGVWIDFAYPGAVAGGEVPALVRLPACHAAGDERYPLAIFLHGKPYTEAQWLDLGLAGLIDAAVADGTMPETVLVLARLPEPLFSGSDGGPGSYEQEMLDGLLPAVEAAFRVESQAGARALVGISRGGVWALEIGMRRPDVFGVVAALSPALSVNYARPAYDPLELALTAPSPPPELLLAAGADDWARDSTSRLHRLLEGRGSPVEVLIVPGRHADDTWRALLPDVVRFLATAFAR